MTTEQMLKLNYGRHSFVKNKLEQEIEMYKENPSQFYSDRFYSKSRRCRPWQIAIGKMLAEKYDIQSAVDFGCGLGSYIDGIKQGGAKDVKGFEYMYDNAKKYIYPEVLPSVEYGDAMSKIDCGKFDCSMSIEVAEHILPEKTDTFIDNITNSSSRLIFFTAAYPGQGGTGHINERKKEFWVDAISSRGFQLAEDGIKEIQLEISKLPFRSRYMSLIKRRIIMFTKENA